MKKKKNNNVGRLDSKLPTLKGGGFLRKHVAPIVNVSPRTIQHYTDIGIVTPEIDSSGGKGSKRLYSARNIFEFLLVQKLLKHGIPLQHMGQIIEKASTQWLRMRDAKILLLFISHDREAHMNYEVQLRHELQFDLALKMKTLSSVIILNISDTVSKMLKF
jgi:DNA-binding transcriptional MerR regulator